MSKYQSKWVNRMKKKGLYKSSKNDVDKNQSQLLLKHDKKIKSLESTRELKYFSNVALGPTALVQTARSYNFYPVTSIDTGDTIDKRTGNKISVKKLSVSLLAGDAPIVNGVRLICYVDKFYDGTDVTKDELLEYASTTSLNFDALISPRNDINVQSFGRSRRRIRVLFDKLIMTRNNNNEQIIHRYTYNKTFKQPLTIEYDNLDDKAGQIRMMFFSGVSTTQIQQPNCRIESHVSFYDS